MNNRRQTNNFPSKSYNSGKYYPKSEGRNTGQNKYQSQDTNFSSRDNRNQPRENTRFQPRTGDRIQGREEGRGYSRNENFRPARDSKFQPRDNRFRKPSDKFAPRRDNKFQDKKRFTAKPKPKTWQNDKLPKIVSDSQITEGKHRGKYMHNTESPKFRVTPRRLREIMFKIIFRRIRGKRFLDLCAGNGMMGIEAMSRGALLGTFVERSAKMCSFIKKNMEICGIKEGHGEVLKTETIPFLKQMKKRRRFWDVVYFNPPYDSNYDEVLDYLSRGTAVMKGGVLVVQHPAEMFFPEKIGQLNRWRVIIQDENAISFFERK